MAAYAASLGEFEHIVMLAVVRLRESARAFDIREEIQDKAQRRVSRGALYATLERLEKKGYLTWETEATTPERGGIPRRRFFVTDDGTAALRASQRALANLSEGLEAFLFGKR